VPGLGFGTLQLLFLHLAMDTGVPTGLASPVLQPSAPITVLLAGLLLREGLTARQAAGVAVAVGTSLTTLTGTRGALALAGPRGRRPPPSCHRGPPWDEVGGTAPPRPETRSRRP
jgi:drug/metabolite transporter (DMT)-like permease